MRRFWLTNTLFVNAPLSYISSMVTGGPFVRTDSKRSSRESNAAGLSSHIAAEKLSVLTSERIEVESSRGGHSSYARSKSKNSQYTVTEPAVVTPPPIRATPSRQEHLPEHNLSK